LTTILAMKRYTSFLILINIAFNANQILATPLSSSAETEQSSLRGRDLQVSVIDNPPIKVLEPNSGGVIAARVRQSLVGTCDTETNVATGEVAKIFAYIYIDPDTMEETCKLTRQVDACFRKTIPIACDPETNIATLELYVIDETFHPTEGAVPNPKIGRCMPGRRDPLVRSISSVESYDCSVQADN